MSDLDTTGRGTAAIVWSRIDSDVSVATRHGDFAGYVDRRGAAEFVVFDQHSRHMGTFPTLEAAHLALGSSVPTQNPSLSWWGRCARSLATPYRYI